MSAPLTVQQAADRLGSTRWWVYSLIRQGRLKTTMFGTAHMIAAKDLDALKIGKVGRPQVRPVKTKAVAL
jgi:excisionase family DNA binding protein